MDCERLTVRDEYVVTLDRGEDWCAELTAFADREEIDAGSFYGIGGVRTADLGLYDWDREAFRRLHFDEPFEVISCLGNVTWRDGERTVHAHAVLSRKDGTNLAGHLYGGTVHFSQIFARAFEGDLRHEFFV